MKVFSRMLLVGLTLIPTVSFGFPGMDRMQTEIRKYYYGTSSAVEGCTDFSGTWVGTCQHGGESENSTVKIEQFKCDALEVGDGFAHSFGGVNGAYDVNSNHAGDTKMSMDWNHHKTVANIGGEASGRMLGKNQWWNSNFKGSLRMFAENTLMIEFGYQWRAKTEAGDVFIGGGNSHCMLKKSDQ